MARQIGRMQMISAVALRRQQNGAAWEHFASQRSFTRMSLDHIYHALSDPSRRAMVDRLANGSGLAISDLAAPLPIALPTVMKHLDVLTRAGLIERRKAGRTVTVTLVPEPMAEAMAWLARVETFWSARLTRLADVVEAEHP